MPTIQNIEEIKAWQLARNFAQEIFHVYNKEPFARDFGLKDQLNRSSGSIMDNIAEGYGRLGNREFINFLTYAKGSCLEAKSQLMRAFDRTYITNEQLEYFDKQLITIDNHIGGFIAYLKKTDYKGQKFKEPQEQYNINPSNPD